MKMLYNLPCNIAQTLNIIGDKWTLLILHKMFTGSETYKELLDNLEGIPTNLLSQRLKSLEVDELIERKLYQTHPPRYKYTLTNKGYDLENVFNSIILWGEKHLENCHKKLVHEKCGNGIELSYYCPHCKENLKIENLDIKDK